MPRNPIRPAGPAPDRAALHEAALRHLARFSATQAGLVRVLDRRIARWAQLAGVDGAATTAPRAAAREVALALVQAGVVDDAAFAAARARRLSRAGRSRRAVAAHLAAKGVQAEDAAAALPQPEQELASALAFARRRRLGPFRPDDVVQEADRHRRDLGALARAGFAQDVARQALGMDPETAQATLLALKSA